MNLHNSSNLLQLMTLVAKVATFTAGLQAACLSATSMLLSTIFQHAGAGFPVLYLHMLRQRKKMLGKTKAKFS